MCVHICVRLHVCVHVCECTQICVDGYMGYVCAHMYTHALRVVKYTCIVVGLNQFRLFCCLQIVSNKRIFKHNVVNNTHARGHFLNVTVNILRVAMEKARKMACSEYFTYVLSYL